MLAVARSPDSHAARAAATSPSGSLPPSPRFVSQSRGAATAVDASTTEASDDCVFVASAAVAARAASEPADS